MLADTATSILTHIPTSTPMTDIPIRMNIIMSIPTIMSILIPMIISMSMDMIIITAILPWRNCWL
jgi:hypothetical protein